jgi:hypothetical protein
MDSGPRRGYRTLRQRLSDWWIVRKERWRSARRARGDESAGEAARRVVTQAAAILEEEVASGIGAVKKAEHRMIDVPSIRTKNPDAVIHRFRRDAHEVVDILVDLAGAAIGSVGVATRRAVEIRGEVSRSAPAGVATVSVPEAVAAGEAAEAAVLVENDGDSATDIFQLTSSDFVSSTGGRIPSAQVTFSPEPIQIPPHAHQRVSLSIRIPVGAEPGVYTGVVQATKLEYVRAVVVVTVKEVSAPAAPREDGGPEGPGVSNVG